MKFVAPFAVAAALTSSALAQDFGSTLLMGLGSSALDKGSDMLKEAPETFDKFLKETEVGRDHATEAACLGELQVGINAGAIMANMLPFSTVHSSEDDRGPVGHFRLMINGEKSRFDVHCDGSRMVGSVQPWGEAPERPATTSRSSFDAAAGLLLLLHMQGAFEGETPETVAGMRTEDPDREPPQTETQGYREVEQLSDAEKARRDAIAAKVYADMGLEPLAEKQTEGMTTDDVIADALDEVLGKPGEAAPRSGPPLSSGERFGFAQEIGACWNIGALSTEAASTTVVVEVQMNPDGTPVASSMRLRGYEGGSEAAGRQAFEAAKRAIIRCGSRGFDLPPEKLARDGLMLIAFDPGRISGSMAGVTVEQIRDR